MCFHVLAALRNHMWPRSYVSASRPSQGCPRFYEEVRRVKSHDLRIHYSACRSVTPVHIFLAVGVATTTTIRASGGRVFTG